MSAGDYSPADGPPDPRGQLGHCKWPRVFKPAKTCNEEGHTTVQNQDQKDQQTE